MDTKQGDSYLFGGYMTNTAPSSYLRPNQLQTSLQTAAGTPLGSNPAIGNGGTLTVVGESGSIDTPYIPAGATLNDVASAINSVQTQTGIAAQVVNNGSNDQIVLNSASGAPSGSYTMDAFSSVDNTGASSTLQDLNMQPVSITSATIPSPSSTQSAQAAIQYQVSASVKMQVNVTGSDIFQSTSSTGLGNTLQSIVNDITNPTKLQNDLKQLDNNLNHVTEVQSSLGSRIQQMTTMQSQTQQFVSYLQNEKASIENANMAQVMTDYTSQQTALQAALQMGSKVLLPSLVQYLNG